MSLVTEIKNLGVSANFRHRAIEIDNLIRSETPIEIPSDEEVERFAFERSIKIENSKCFEPLQVGAKWMKEQIIKTK